jgi:hypothetical protein
MLVALGVAVLAGGASVVVALIGKDSPKAAPTAGSSAGPTAASGAVLADPDGATAFLAGATSDIGAVTSYDYRHLDDALSAGLGVTTGAYRASFRSALTGANAAAARTDHVVHQFEVLDLGIGSTNASGTRAEVLIFGRQTSTDAAHPRSQTSIISLRATMVRQGARYLIADLQQDADAGTPAGSPQLARAVEAGRAEVVNALTYTRSQFDADLRRAQAGAVDPLRAELGREAPTTRKAMAGGGYDLTGVVVASAVKSAAGTSVTMLVAAESSRIGASGSQVTPVRYEVTATLTGGRWLVSRIEALSAQ